MATPDELDQWLHQGIQAAKAGQFERARFLLLDVVEQDQAHETAWYWLYKVSERQDDKRVCLENLVLLNPNNQWAKRALLDHLIAHPSVASPARVEKSKVKDSSTRQPSQFKTRSLPLKLIMAFWLGISLIFLSGGIISAGEWLAFIISGQIELNDLNSFQAFDLFTTVGFIIVGLLSLFVTISLFLKSMVGFFGSLILALMLLLVGPTLSLITRPPNYATMICTGGIAGMIVLLTLASQSGLTGKPIRHETVHQA